MSAYLGVLIYTCISTLLAILILVVSYKVSPRRLDMEKATAYECGFDPFGEARSPFEVSFYLVAILFLVFDIEVAYLFPWALSLADLSWEGFWSMLLFLWILVVGFIYEWKKGALDWN
jgi:NADH:ubiquinone oxidoreductase subunit 3 (subunit A)